ncbi:hypothetical protein [Pantoea sp.]|uniref:hypothetical protein n=1 Tax=Pantoea sp. TaxID=69393 RepID=UPI0028A8A9C4|nr:hypothetical protein [Pantoea sp.]
MDTWLVSFQAEWQGACSEEHVLIRSQNLLLAEAGCMHMGRTWWKGDACESEGYSWRFGGNDVWLKSIILLSDAESETLSGLRFLDYWTVTGTPDSPVVRDRNDNHWLDFRD